MAHVPSWGGENCSPSSPWVAPILDFNRGLPGGLPVGFAHTVSHPQGHVYHGELNTPHPCRMEAGAGSDHDGTRNMSRAVHLLYLFRYQIGGGMAVLSHGFVST